MAIIIKNNSGDTVHIPGLGFSLLNGAQRDVGAQFDNSAIFQNEDLLSLIEAGILVVNDGVNDLDASQGKSFLSEIMPSHFMCLIGCHFIPQYSGCSIIHNDDDDLVLLDSEDEQGGLNLYKHVRTNTTLGYVSIKIDIKLPGWFRSWKSNSLRLKYKTTTANIADNKVYWAVYRDTTLAVSVDNLVSTSLTTSIITEGMITQTITNWSQNDKINLVIRLYSSTGYDSYCSQLCLHMI